MLDTLLVIAGCIVVLALFVDALITTLAASAGAGPLTAFVFGGLWRVLLRLHRDDAESSFLCHVGTLFFAATVLLWVSLLWTGWSLVFIGSGGVLDSQSLQPVGTAEVIGFTGSAVFTLGSAEHIISGSTWGIVAPLAGFTGLFLVTLTITYLVEVVTAVVDRRALATQIDALGTSTSQILTNAWNGTRFDRRLEEHLVDLVPSIATCAAQHLAYPVLHYFHSETKRLEASVAIANLDDALLVLDEVVDPDHRPERSAVQPLRFAIGRYLAATGSVWSPDRDAPAPPGIESLRDSGIPIVADAELRAALERNRERRSRLHQTVAGDGWSWPSS